MKALRIILASIKRADKDFNLFNDNDRICVGISGGKDSMALLYALTLYKKYTGKKITIMPCIIDLGFPGLDTKPIADYCSSLSLSLNVLDGKTVYKILSIQQEKQHTPHLPCSICSKMKKAIINKFAKQTKCNKVSFAHHLSDAVETLFLNEIYGARIATFAPKMFLSNEEITFIRPFIYVDESIIKRCIKEENIPVFSSHCPNDGHTKRQEIKDTLASIYKTFPDAKNNFGVMLNNREKEDLFYNAFETQINSKNFYYKEIYTIDDYIKELDFYSNIPCKDPLFSNFSKDNSSGQKHYLVYKKEKIVCALDLIKDDRTFTITKYKFLKYEDFATFMFAFYRDIYEKFNPCKMIIKSKKKDFLNEINFVHKEKNIYCCTENPVNIEKKNKIISK
ncbi:MAG: tRNA 2-thiocytidine biosynthesis protein TtcA [Erysipelotrichaceae bacterium]|nr:tRNA 2-thiocytidine biosynthesis protein TtcA [Erysipelotrichaceae bacterium]